MVLSDHLRATLSGAPELLRAPALGTAIAMGSNVTNGIQPEHSRAIAAIVVLGLMAQGMQELF